MLCLVYSYIVVTEPQGRLMSPFDFRGLGSAFRVLGLGSSSLVSGEQAAMMSHARL